MRKISPLLLDTEDSSNSLSLEREHFQNSLASIKEVTKQIVKCRHTEFTCFAFEQLLFPRFTRYAAWKQRLNGRQYRPERWESHWDLANRQWNCSWCQLTHVIILPHVCICTKNRISHIGYLCTCIWIKAEGKSNWMMLFGAANSIQLWLSYIPHAVTWILTKRDFWLLWFWTRSS